MCEREELERAMAVLDGQRTVLGDAAVEAALDGLQQKLSALEQGESAAPALAGERRVATILFCDVKSSTAMAGKLDPEEWAGILRRAMAFLNSPSPDMTEQWRGGWAMRFWHSLRAARF